MPKRSRKPAKPDLNQIAARIVAQTTGGTVSHEKNPAAVSLGRLGGLKGGKARAESLTGEERARIAKKAATARWKRHGND